MSTATAPVFRYKECFTSGNAIGAATPTIFPKIEPGMAFSRLCDQLSISQQPLGSVQNSASR